MYLDQKKAELIRDDMVALCLKHGLSGFAGLFRFQDSEHISMWVESPKYSDGYLRFISDMVNSINAKYGGTTTSQSEGLYRPPAGPDNP